MPRLKARKERAPDPRDKLSKFISALLDDPDATCIGGSDMCCSGCSGGQELVETLAGFISQNDAARRLFVAMGGLEALLILIGRVLGEDADYSGYLTPSKVETQAMGALVLLQCFCASPGGQTLLIAHKPALVHMVCQVAQVYDEEWDGAKHAALQVLAGWHMSNSEESIPLGSRSLAHWLADQSRQGLAQGVLKIALEALSHPMLPLRKSAAQLLTSAVVTLPMVHPEALTILSELANNVLSSINDRSVPGNHHSTSPNIVPTSAMLKARKVSEERERLLALGMLTVVGDLAQSGDEGAHHMLMNAGCATAVVAAFCSAWDLPHYSSILEARPPPRSEKLDNGARAGESLVEARPPSHTESLDNGAIARGAVALPFQFTATREGGQPPACKPLLNDHQSKEQALDALVLFAEHSLGLLACGAEHPLGAEVAAVRQLSRLLMALLRQPTPGHIRAMMTLLSRVQMEVGPLGGSAATHTAAGGSTISPEASASMNVHVASSGPHAGVHMKEGALEDGDPPSHADALPQPPVAVTFGGDAAAAVGGGGGAAVGAAAVGGGDGAAGGGAAASVGGGAVGGGGVEETSSLSKIDGGMSQGTSDVVSEATSNTVDVSQGTSKSVSVGDGTSETVVVSQVADEDTPAALDASTSDAHESTIPELQQQQPQIQPAQELQAQQQLRREAYADLFNISCHLFDLAWESDCEAAHSSGIQPEAIPDCLRFRSFELNIQVAEDCGGIGEAPSSGQPSLSPGDPGPSGDGTEQYDAVRPFVEPHRCDPLDVGSSLSQLKVDVGLGYRVLLQVLQGWKHLLDSSCQPAIAALNTTCWWQRASLAIAHDRMQVAVLAEQVAFMGQPPINLGFTQPDLTAFDASHSSVTFGTRPEDYVPLEISQLRVRSGGKMADGVDGLMHIDAEMQEFLQQMIMDGDGDEDPLGALDQESIDALTRDLAEGDLLGTEGFASLKSAECAECECAECECADGTPQDFADAVNRLIKGMNLNDVFNDSVGAATELDLAGFSLSTAAHYTEGLNLNGVAEGSVGTAPELSLASLSLSPSEGVPGLASVRGVQLEDASGMFLPPDFMLSALAGQEPPLPPVGMDSERPTSASPVGPRVGGGKDEVQELIEALVLLPDLDELKVNSVCIKYDTAECNY